MADLAAKPRGLPVRSPAFVALLLGLLVSAGMVRGQEGENKPLRLHEVIPAGTRTSVTDKSSGTYQFILDNPNAMARNARVVVFYARQPELQYARDIWVPGRASLRSWLTVGPAPNKGNDVNREIKMVLYDRTDGTDRLVLPGGEERQRSRVVLYRRRDPTTTLFADLPPPPIPGEPEPDAAPSDAVLLARLCRAADSLSEQVSLVQEGAIPTTADLFDGIDVCIVAGNRLTSDPAGRAALRRWVEAGGKLWVMLDHIDPATVAPVLGDDFEVGLVDRVGLTTLHLVSLRSQRAEPARDFEQPVPFVRVLPAATDRIIATANGWPAAFVRNLGRGQVLFTTLGAAGWSERRERRHGPSPYRLFLDFPVPIALMSEISGIVFPTPEPDLLPAEAFQPMLAEEIGYSVIGRNTAAVILGAFVLIVVALGVALRRSRRPELVGWLCPAAAMVAAAVFVILGEQSRRAVPPTIGVAAVAYPAAGPGEAALSGLYAVYHSASGPADLGTHSGAVLGLDTEGLDGQTRVRVQTDIDAWHWEGLSLPAGVRTGSFRSTIKTGRVAAVARFGPDGVEGKLESGSLQGLADAIIATPMREPLAVRLGTGGRFTANAADALAEGQFFSAGVLTDKQQRRQELYRQALTVTTPRPQTGREMLLVWADPNAMPLSAAQDTRVVGGLLLAVPLEFERVPPNTRVTVPRGFATYRRVQEDRLIPATLTGQQSSDMRLRFQLPASVLPLRVERATFFARVKTPSRRFTVSGIADKKEVSLYKAEGPVDPIRIEITDPALLRLDAQGGLHLNVTIGSPLAGASKESQWSIEMMSLEVVGQTAESK